MSLALSLPLPPLGGGHMGGVQGRKFRRESSGPQAPTWLAQLLSGGKGSAAPTWAARCTAGSLAPS